MGQRHAGQHTVDWDGDLGLEFDPASPRPPQCRHL